MKDKLKKLFNTFLTMLLLCTSLGSNVTSVYAMENDIDHSESTDEIVELGYAKDIFGTSNQNARSTPAIGEWYAYVDMPGSPYGYDIIAHLTIDGQTVFCLEPMRLFNTSGEYPIDTVFWQNLSEAQRQAIWEINYYGYSYPGHQNGRYYAATQLLIWEVVDKMYSPMTPDGSTPLDLSAEINEINRLRSQPQGRPSFDGSTIKTGLNTPVTLTDTKGTLENYTITSGNGVKVSASGNNLTATITSETYDNTITFDRTLGARDVMVIFGSNSDQRVIYLAKRSDPTPNFKLNFELLYADIEIEKQDVETGTNPQGDATFNGAAFTISNMDGNVLETIKTNGSKAVSKKYPVGTSYKVCEVSPPEGYLENDACQTVKLEYSGETTPVRFSTIYTDKVIKGKISLMKSVDHEEDEDYGSIIQHPGKNFVFDIYLKSSGEKIATLTTDEDGRATSDYLPYGTYIVKEQAKEGFDTLEPFEVKIDENDKTYYYNIFNDTLKAELTIYKIDAETGNKIPTADVEFKIKDSEGNFITQTVNYPTKYETDVFKTDETGSVHLPEPLVYGNYSIVEIKAPYGYVLEDEEIPLNIDGTSTEIFINFENSPQKGQISIEKYGEQFTRADFRATEYGVMYSPIYENTFLEGVTYEIKAKEDIIGEEGTVWYEKGEVVDTITTDKNGETKSKLLPLGSYTLEEAENVEGYVLDPTVYDVEIEYEGQIVEVVSKHYTMNNERQKLDLEITKSFEDEDPDAYKDVVFGIYSEDDIQVGDTIEIPEDGLVGILTLDENGKNKEQYDLPVGNYYIKELKTNVGYVLDEEEYPFTFEYTDDASESHAHVELEEIENMKRRIDLEVKKVDKDNHDILLNGAVFEVIDKTTNTNLGIAVSGKLAIKGNEVNEEYEIAKDEDFKDIVTTAKTNESKEIILDLEDGTYYSRKVGSEEVKKHIVKAGYAVLADAVYGHEYEFKEIEAPSSYELNEEPLLIDIIVDKGKDTITYVFYNDRIEVPNTGV